MLDEDGRTRTLSCPPASPAPTPWRWQLGRLCEPEQEQKKQNRLLFKPISLFDICIVSLKGQCHEIFDPFFIYLNYSIWVPDMHAKTVFNSFLVSWRYLLK